MWRARLHYDTGFNSINVPDSEVTLVKASENIRTFSAMDILQRYHLSNISIRAFEDDVIRADYLKIYDENNEDKCAYYTIKEYNMTSGDVVDLTVFMEPFLTSGGIDNIDFSDGMTRRHHVSDDTYGAYQEDDPLLIPTRVYCAQAGGYGDITDDMVIIAISNYEIFPNSEIKCNNNRHLQIISDGNDGYTISSQHNPNSDYNDSPIFKITPRILPDKGTEMHIGTPFGIDTNEGYSYSYPNSYGDVYHIFNCRTDLSGRLGSFIGKVNELIEYGRSDIIKNIYLVPKRIMKSQGYGDDSHSDGRWTPSLQNAEEGPFRSISNNLISHIVFDNTHGTLLDPVRKYYDATYTKLMYIDQDYNDGAGDSDYYKGSDIHNKRVFYGKHFAYTFTSPTSGEKCTINPEMLKAHIGRHLEGGPSQENLPFIAFTADIRENGKPVFYIYTYGDDDVEVQTTPISVDKYHRVPKYKINGSTWPTMSISTIAARNYRLNKDKYLFDADASALKSAMQMYHDINPLGNAGILTMGPEALKMINTATNPVDDIGILNSYMGAQDRIGHATPILPAAAIKQASQGNTLALNIANREIEKASEREQFITANLPQVEVISKSSGDGIVVPNGLLIYRNYIDPTDAKKFDRILNQFGYKITEPMKKEFLGNRLGYNYVEVSGASVIAKNVPMSVRKDLANLFSTGVRIWHKKPDYDYSQPNGINIHFNEEEVNNND